MIKKSSLTLALLMCLTIVYAQEFWMYPDNFFYNKGETLKVSFSVGENFIAGPSALQRNQIKKVELHQVSKTLNLLDSARTGKKDNLACMLTQDGTALLAMQIDDALIELPADQFNNFLKEQGLDEILDRRQKDNTHSLPVKALQARFVKLLIQVGEKKEDTYKKATGFPVDIIPEKNPYALSIGESIRFRILFDGKPAFGVRVKVWNRFDNRTTLQNIYTEKDGTMEARISSAGPWMVSVVKMVPANQPVAEWQSCRGTLVFGIR